MKLKLNGRDHEIEGSTTLKQLIRDMDMDNRPVVVELNGKVISAESLSDVILNENDRVEVVTFVGGG